MDRNQVLNTGLWITLFTVSASIAALSYAGYFPAERGFLEIQYKVVLGILGAVAGLVTFYFTWRREDWIKGLAYLGLIAVLVGGAYLFPPATAISNTSDPINGAVNISPGSRLLTCPVCGYKTLQENKSPCPVCYVELSDTERIVWDYPDMEKMIEEEQAMFFAAEGFREEDFFYQPPRWELDGVSFKKDTIWQPRIEAERVRRLRDTLIEVGVIEVLE